jgi:inosine/xanthosine triphosphate pyrophosphatase family protein/adenylate kinase family enzyme
MLDIYFITSNRSKLEHAKFLCRGYNVNIHKQVQYGIGYVEPRIKDRELLLKESIKDAVRRLEKVVGNLDQKFVIIEDTSVIIDALSDEDNEFPGVDVKYWMKEIHFTELDNILKQNSNNRKVTVRSDLVLFLPKILQKKLGSEFKYFTSSSKGKITDVEHEIETQPLYPWLSGKTFSKWFIPNGEKISLSSLNISNANKHDFRKGAFDDMLAFLKENSFVRKKTENKIYFRQLNLFDLNLFIICGPTCAGKTTISDYLTRYYGFYHIEASDFMYLSYYEKHTPYSDVKIGDFAEKALIENASIVVDQIIKHLSELRLGLLLPIVISGFRSPEEIKSFKKKYAGGLDIQEIYIDAHIQIRFDRAIKRKRSNKVMTLKDFKKIDAQQNDMGLPLIKKEIPLDNIVINDKTLSEYYKSFEQQFSETLQFYPKKTNQKTISPLSFYEAPYKLEHAILIAMSDKTDDYLTTTQIAHLVNSKFVYPTKKGKDNISRYFNYRYHPYYEIKIEQDKIKYKLSQTGYSFSQLLIQKYSKGQ